MNLEQEWRQHLLSEIKELRKDVKSIQGEMTTLKVKVALFSSIVGGIVSFIANKIFQHP
jgi:hypothetical protein